MQTFEQFQATRKTSFDIEADCGEPEMRNAQGFIYTSDDGSQWWIEEGGYKCGNFFCMMYNEDFCSDDLAAVELWLYENHG